MANMPYGKCETKGGGQTVLLLFFDIDDWLTELEERQFLYDAWENGEMEEKAG